MCLAEPDDSSRYRDFASCSPPTEEDTEAKALGRVGLKWPATSLNALSSNIVIF